MENGEAIENKIEGKKSLLSIGNGISNISWAIGILMLTIGVVMLFLKIVIGIILISMGCIIMYIGTVIKAFFTWMVGMANNMERQTELLEEIVKNK